jgi:transposase InsO family protein
MTWEREQWVEEYLEGERISEIAERHEVSRKTVYKWIERYEGYGAEGLRELSRAPRQHPQAVSELWRERIRAARQHYPRWGAPKLQWALERRHGKEEVPSASTIGRVLRESGLSRPRRRVRAHGTGRLSEAEHANQVWAIDFKGWRRTGDGRRCEPLTITDQATRYLLCCQALESTNTAQVRAVMERVFERYGLPERMRSDNGAPFAVRGECGLSELAVWWLELGIESERIEPGHPQQNGRHERMHRTLQEATLTPPASTLRQQQRRFDEFRQEYNQDRPHQSLSQQVPAAVYAPSAREYPRSIAEPDYGRWPVRQVCSGGKLGWISENVFVSHSLRGKRLGLECIGEDLWNLWFYRHWLGVWERGRGRLWRPREWTERRSAQGCAAAPESLHAEARQESHPPSP